MRRAGKVRIAVTLAAAAAALALPPWRRPPPSTSTASAPPAGADGSIDHPWTSLSDVHSTLAPGDSILLRRGTFCAGTLASTAPDRRLPRNCGCLRSRAGTGDRGTWPGCAAARRTRASRRSRTSPSRTPATGTSKRRGLHLVAAGQTVEGLVARNLHIHDVGGNLDKDDGGSGGIQVDSVGPGLGRFADLRITGNTIEDVSRSGIFVVGTSQGGSRPRSGQPWPEASTGVEISGNRIDETAGDGIVVLGSDRAHIASNVVSRGNLAGRGLSDPQGLLCNAGIWAFNSNGTVIEHNEVFGMKFNGCDGTGFDVDYMQDGTVIQFNYSHDNEGGFLLLCTDSQPRTSTVRFNLSLDDGYALNSSPCSEPLGTYTGIDIYNNTIVSPDPGFALLGTPAHQLFGPASLSFFNNIVVATGGTGPGGTGRGFNCEPSCRNNLFWHLSAAGSDPVYGDPRFIDGSRRGSDAAAGFRLGARSAAFGAAAPIPEDATVDYFGQPIDRSRPPNIGFDQSAPPLAKIRKIRVTPRAFRPKTGRGPSLVKQGGATRILVRIDAPARVAFRVTSGRGDEFRRLPGRFGAEVDRGPNELRFTGRLRNRPLKPGRYRLEASVAGQRQAVTGFRVKRSKPR